MSYIRKCHTTWCCIFDCLTIIYHHIPNVKNFFQKNIIYSLAVIFNYWYNKDVFRFVL